MPLRMLIDAGAVAPGDVALVGARNLDPPEVEFIARAAASSDDVAARARRTRRASTSRSTSTCSTRRGRASFMPEPGGPTLAEVEALLRDVARARSRRASA